MTIKNTYLSFKKICSENRALRLAYKTFVLIILIALLAPFIANDKPLVCKYKNTWLFPAFSFKQQLTLPSHEILNYNMGKEWKKLETDFSIFPPCSYSPNSIDAENAPLKSPFAKQIMTLKNNVTISLPLKYRHWLGTTQNGNDVLACIIHGSKIAISVGGFSMLIAALIGIILGAFAGYYEDNQFKVGFIQLGVIILGVVCAWFYGVITRHQSLELGFNKGGIELLWNLLLSIFIFITIIIICNLIGKKIDTLLNIKKNIHFPIDLIISKSIEILNSIPSLLLIIAISAITKPSFTVLTLIIGFFGWTLIARTTRAEFLKAKQLDYVTSCKVIGMSNTRIMFKHILPNIIPILLVQIVFGMASAVIIESSLSFIGIGVPVDTLTWGSLLNEGRDHFSAWWLVIFPGLSIFTLIIIYNTFANALSHIKKPSAS